MGNLTFQDSGRGSHTRPNRLLEAFFLARLQRIVAVRRERAPLLEAGTPDIRMLDWAVFSTYCDCLDLGVGEDARTVLRGEEWGASHRSQ